MSDHESEATREAFASAASNAGWRCRLCENAITYEDKEAFFATGKGLCSRCQHNTQKD
jgi:hypothetical protein